MAIFIVKIKLFQMVFFIKLPFPKNGTKSVNKIDPDCTVGTILWTMFESFFFWKWHDENILFEIFWPLICAVYWWQSNGGWRSGWHQKSYEQCIEKVSTTAIQASSKQSHYIKSRAGRDFLGKENEIWAGFGPVGNTEKKWLISGAKNCFRSFKKHCM